MISEVPDRSRYDHCPTPDTRSLFRSVSQENSGSRRRSRSRSGSPEDSGSRRRSRNRSGSPEDSGSRRRSRNRRKKEKRKSSRKRSRRRRSADRYRDRLAVEEEIEPQYTRSQKTKFADLLRAMRYATSEDQLRWGQSAEQLGIKDSRIVSLCEDMLEQVDKRTRGY